MEHARPPAELCLEGGPATRAQAWRKWHRQFVVFLKASGVYKETSDVQASLLINLIGPEGYDIYCTFKFTKDESSEDFDTIIKKFNSHFGTKQNIAMTRFKFFTRVQETGESIDEYVTALRLLSQCCEFEHLEDGLLRDRIVCGIRNTETRDRLLRADDLTLEKAVKICQVNEISNEEKNEIEGIKTQEDSAAGTSSASMDEVYGAAGGSRGSGRGWRGARRYPAVRGRGGGGGGGAGGAGGGSPCDSCAGYNCHGGYRCPARSVKCFMELVTDNGPAYASKEFSNFCKDWGFRHVTTSPNYPQSNGRSERTVRTVKDIIRKSTASGSDFYVGLLNFRATPRNDIASPAELLMGRRINTRLPIHESKLRPTRDSAADYGNILKRQDINKRTHDTRSRALPKLEPGQKVVIADGAHRKRGVVQGAAAQPRSYFVSDTSGRRYRRNRRHLLPVPEPGAPAAGATVDEDDHNHDTSSPVALTHSNYHKE